MFGVRIECTAVFLVDIIQGITLFQKSKSLTYICYKHNTVFITLFDTI